LIDTLKSFYHAEKIKIKEFALLMLAVVLLLSLGVGFRHPRTTTQVVFAGIGLFFSLGWYCPGILRPVYALWMVFAFVLGYVNTRIFLALVFYVIITPIALLLRVFEVDPLDRGWGNRKKRAKISSYWRKRTSPANGDANWYLSQFDARPGPGTRHKRNVFFELFYFLISRRSLWLVMIFFVLLIVGTLFVFLQTSVIAPFIYTIF